MLDSILPLELFIAGLAAWVGYVIGYETAVRRSHRKGP